MEWIDLLKMLGGGAIIGIPIMLGAWLQINKQKNENAKERLELAARQQELAAKQQEFEDKHNEIARKTERDRYDDERLRKSEAFKELLATIAQLKEARAEDRQNYKRDVDLFQDRLQRSEKRQAQMHETYEAEKNRASDLKNQLYEAAGKIKYLEDHVEALEKLLLPKASDLALKEKLERIDRHEKRNEEHLLGLHEAIRERSVLAANGPIPVVIVPTEGQPLPVIQTPAEAQPAPPKPEEPQAP